LSIEEQWYLVFPIAALLCRKAIRRRPKLVTAALEI
jgi:peptidoglycan/LPS O-acetylase OafA/YrhL